MLLLIECQSNLQGFNKLKEKKSRAFVVSHNIALTLTLTQQKQKILMKNEGSLCLLLFNLHILFKYLNIISTAARCRTHNFICD